MLFPFKNIYLQSTLSREQICEELSKNTFVIGHAEKQENRIFYGQVSVIDFALQNIKNQNLSSFVEGKIYGYDSETYLHIVLKGLKYRRAYLLLLLVWLVGVVYLGFQLIVAYKYLFLLFPAIGSLLICTLLLVLLWVKTRKFAATIEPSIAFFKEVLHAVSISENEIPSVLVNPN